MRSGGLLWLSSLLLVALPGAPLLAHSGFARIPIPGRAVLAGAAGAVLVSFAMTVFALLGVPWSLPLLLVAAGLLAFLLRPVLGAAPASAREPPPEVPARRCALAAGALSGLAVAAALLATAAGSASSPDLIFFWGPKAQQFALARTVDARFLADPYLSYMHAYYPPLVTNLYAWASMAAGRMSWTAATLLFPLLLAALALGLPGILRTAAARAQAAAASALAVCTIACIGMEADIGGNGEMPLLLFETAGVALLLSPLSAGAAGQLLAGLLFAGAVCAKIEGLPFALAAVAAFLWVRRRGAARVGPAAARLLAPAAISLGAWFAFGAARHLFRGYSGEGRLVDLHPEYAGVVLRGLARTLAATGYGLPYLIPAICLLVVIRRLNAASAIPLATAAGVLAFAIAIYLDRPENPSLWIAWSAARVLSPIPVLLTLAAACARDAPPSPGARTAPATSP